LVLLIAGFVAFHQEGEPDEERSDWLQRKWLGILLMAVGASSLVITILAAFE
jgi:hypothetical protein